MTSPHAMWPLENATVCLWENDSEKGKWCFGVIIKVVLTSQAPWNGLKELRFLDQLWEPLPQRKSRHQTCLKKSAAALHIIAKPRNDPKSINWYLHAMHYDAPIKRNQLHLCLTIRVTLWVTESSHGKIHSAFIWSSKTAKINKVLVKNTSGGKANEKQENE